MTQFYSGIAGRRPNAAKGVVIHNDAGSQNANAEFYHNWLPTHEAENGFAHVYIGSDGRYQADDYNNMAWHTANPDGNANYAAWEVCQSMGDEATFLRNEQEVFKDVANYMKSVGMTPNRNTVRLHKEFSSTDCPHRSWALHGRSVDAVKDYFISQIQKYIGGTLTPASNTPKPQPTSKPTATNDVDYMRQYGQVKWNGKQFKVDDRSRYGGILQVVSNELGGLTPTPTTSETEWINNGVPMSAISWTDGTPQSSVNGGRFKFDQDVMAIVDYDVASNGIAVMVSGHKVWVDATVARKA